MLRFQANLLVRPIEELSIFQEVPRIFIPAMWFEQKFTMDPDMANQLKIAVEIPWIGRVIGLILLAIGITLTIISYVITYLQSKRKPNRQQMEINLCDRQDAPRQKKEVSPLLHRQVRPQIVQQRLAAET